MAKTFVPSVKLPEVKAPMPTGFHTGGLMGAGAGMPHPPPAPKPVTTRSTGIAMPKQRKPIKL